MKCLSCGTEIDSGKHSVCPVCGLDIVSFIADTDAELVELINNERNYAKTYFDRIVNKMQIRISVYNYSAKELSDLENGNMVEKEDALIFDIGELEIGKVQWFPEAFVRIKKDFNLKVMITDRNEVTVTSVLMKDPQCDGDYQQIGVLLKEGLGLEILTGVEEKYSSSERIELIAKKTA